MRTMPSAHRLAEVLPGAWQLGASNLLFWLDRRHGEPRFTFDVATPSPLLLSETIEFDGEDGRRRSVHGKAKLVRGEMVWRGSGLRSAITRRWSVLGLSGDATIVVIRYRDSRLIPGGVSLLVREGVEIDELRSVASATASTLGLTPEDFASLTWMR
jgi:hypothetical protein